FRVITLLSILFFLPVVFIFTLFLWGEFSLLLNILMPHRAFVITLFFHSFFIHLEYSYELFVNSFFGLLKTGLSFHLSIINSSIFHDLLLILLITRQYFHRKSFLPGFILFFVKDEFALFTETC